MAPHPATNGQVNGDVDNTKARAVTVLVTGFGPFQERYPVNPSFEIARTLPLSIDAGDDLQVEILSYGRPIRVCYDEVRELVPAIHKTYHDRVDLVLHIGMASGRDHYTAELYAHRDGYYKNKDLDGKTLPADHGLRYFGECPPMMCTSLDFPQVLQNWKAHLHDLPEASRARDADCRPSEDAGHYLCDYIYFNSLAWYARTPGRDNGTTTDRPVLFLHVPAESDPDALEKGREVTLALIKAMVESWCQSAMVELV